jgi:hypothetical protein
MYVGGAAAVCSQLFWRIWCCSIWVVNPPKNEMLILMAVMVELLSAPVFASTTVAAHLVGKSSSNKMWIAGTMALMVEVLSTPTFSGIVDTMVVTMVVVLLQHFLVDLVLKTHLSGVSSLNEMLKLTGIKERPLVGYLAKYIKQIVSIFVNYH